MTTSMQKSAGRSPQVVDTDDDIEIIDGGRNGGIEIAQAREIQEVQAAMTVAKRFPRDEDTAYAKVMKACKRPKLAESSQYEYPRGGQTVTGPSIRLAETLARCWGNLQFGVSEIARRRGYSECVAFAWDVETNVRPTLSFTVRHQRDTRQGIVILTEERDINELILNQGMRRLRNCILKLIPSDLVDDAVEQCNKTLTAADKDVPIADRIRKMAAAFLDLHVNTKMLEARLGHKLAATTETELVTLRKTFQAIKDGATSAAEAFSAQVDPNAKDVAKKTRAQELKEKLGAQVTEPPVASAPADEPSDEPHPDDVDPPT
jgi:hypothetical protein